VRVRELKLLATAMRDPGGTTAAQVQSPQEEEAALVLAVPLVATRPPAGLQHVHQFQAAGTRHRTLLPPNILRPRSQ